MVQILVKGGKLDRLAGELPRQIRGGSLGELLGKHGGLEEDRACMGNTYSNKEGLLRIPLGVSAIF